MKYFLFFCVAYSVTLYAGNQKKLDKAKKTINEIKHTLNKKSSNS